MSGHTYLGKTSRIHMDAVDGRVRTEREDAWGELPGRIVSFDPEKQTARVQPLYRKRLASVPTDLPELIDVPVHFARAGDGALTFPVKAGDRVTLRPSMRSTEAYHSEGSEDGYAASDSRSFSLSDMEAYVTGGESLVRPIRNFDGENAHLRFDDEGRYGIRGSADGKVRIEGSEGNVYALLAAAIRLIGSDELLIKHGSSSGSGHQLENRDAILAIADKLDAMAL